MIKEEIKEDLKVFMKEKNKVATTTLRTLNADILKKEKDSKVVLTDEEVISTISKAVTQYNETLSFAIKANNQETIEDCKLSISILEKYLPKQLSESEVRDIISKAIVELEIKSKKDMGKLMKELMPKLNGKFDKKKVNPIIQELLGN